MFILFCSHLKATLFAQIDLETYNDEKTGDVTQICQPVAYQCVAYGDFINGECASCQDCGCQLAGPDLQIGRTELRGQGRPRVPGPIAAQNLYLLQNWFIGQGDTYPYCRELIFLQCTQCY